MLGQVIIISGLLIICSICLFNLLADEIGAFVDEMKGSD